MPAAGVELAAPATDTLADPASLNGGYTVAGRFELVNSKVAGRNRAAHPQANNAWGWHPRFLAQREETAGS